MAFIYENIVVVMQKRGASNDIQDFFFYRETFSMDVKSSP